MLGDELQCGRREREAQLQGVEQQEQGGTDLVCSGTEGNVLPGSQAARQGMGRNAKVDYRSAFVPWCLLSAFAGCSCCSAAVTATCSCYYYCHGPFPSGHAGAEVRKYLCIYSMVDVLGI